jgi:hypothetical protein
MNLKTWIDAKITECELKIKTREHMSATLRSGTDEDWDAAANLHPMTASKVYLKRDREIDASRNERITEHYRFELKMLKECAEVIANQNASKP